MSPTASFAPPRQPSGTTFVIVVSIIAAGPRHKQGAMPDASDAIAVAQAIFGADNRIFIARLGIHALF